MNKHLYLFALQNQNEEFVNYCLKHGVFGKEILNEDDTIAKSMSLIYEGRKTLFLLKCFAYYDFNAWQKRHIRDFITLSENLYKTGY